ncbi:MAG: response regulator transcription factor [Eubacteriales bacterium]
MKRILLIEDDKNIVLGLEFLLKKQYDLTIAYSKKEAMEKLQMHYDLILLDIMLGDGNGLELAELIADTPILFLTARDDEETIVKGLALGEDYLIKPFRNQELLARIEKILARTNRDVIMVGELELDKSKKTIRFQGTFISLTSLEYKILELLVVNKNQVIPRERILEVIWDSNENYVNDNTLTVNIKRIRAKLSSEYIKTVKGFGYMVDEHEL